MSELSLGASAVEVTDVAERERTYNMGVTAPIRLDVLPEECAEAWAAAGGKDEYTFPRLKTYDQVMQGMIELMREGKVAEALAAVQQASIKPYHEKSPVEKWAHWAYQMPGDWGPRHPTDRRHMRERLTSAASGIVLEAMCGFTSYVDDSPVITEVIAMDFCREALERYDHPDRRRILFDLNDINGDNRMDFLADESLGTVCITFGVDYLHDSAAVYDEFGRVLVPQGKVLIIGGRACGYNDLLKQHFEPGFHAGLLEASGFDVRVEALPYGGQGDEAEFHLIEATKPSAAAFE